MKYYAAVVNADEIAATTLIPPACILASYHYFAKKGDLLAAEVKKGVDVFIDSGAFSAANSNKEIDIDKYCKFLKEVNAPYYAGLDVIGDADATMENQKYMEGEYGLRPIPTFHMGSPLEKLEGLMEYNYIALGGLVFSSGIESHCDQVWNFMLKQKPNIQVHGFGLTNVELMSRYPWYSVDSSSFKGCKRFGRQNILWRDFEFKTFSEDEYLNFLKVLRYDPETLTNKDKWFLYDFFSCQSYKQYAAFLSERNKYKSFEALAAQTTLF